MCHEKITCCIDCMGENDHPVALIFRSHLLAKSETFVKAQCEALRRYTGIYVGLRRDSDGLNLASEHIALLSNRRRLQIFLRPSKTDVTRLAQLKPRIMHAHFGTDAILARPLACALGVPLLVSLHGFDVTIRPEVFRRGSLGFGLNMLYPGRLRNLFASPGVSYLAVSKFIREKAIGLGCPADRIVVHHIGIDLSAFSSSADLHLAARGKRILFVGRLVEKKGCSFLIQAVRRLKLLVPNVELRIIGEGPLRASLERQAGEAGIAATFLGSQPQEVVRAEMDIARVFCVPSVIAGNGDAEGFGMVFIEAQCMGLPAVSFESGGISDAIVHGQTGLLAGERDVKQLAEYLELLLSDDDRWLELSRQGKQLVTKQFSLVEQTKILERLYDSCLTA